MRLSEIQVNWMSLYPISGNVKETEVNQRGGGKVEEERERERKGRGFTRKSSGLSLKAE